MKQQPSISMVSIGKPRQSGGSFLSCLLRGQTIFYVTVMIALGGIGFVLTGGLSDDISHAILTSDGSASSSGGGSIRKINSGGAAKTQGMAVSKEDPPIPRGTTQVCPTAIMPLYWDKDSHIDKLVINPACPSPHLMVDFVPVAKEKVITFFLIYYNRPDYLTLQLESWMKFSEETRQKTQFLIVDDGSAPGFRAADVLAANPTTLDIQVYEVDQDLDWNIGGARNLGFYVAPIDWVFLSDSDILVRPDTMDYVVNTLVNRGMKKKSIYRNFHRLRSDRVTTKPHPAVMMLSKSAYWLAGGCDEDFVGHYGYTDVHFFFRAEKTKRLQVNYVEQEMKDKPISPLEELPDVVDCPADMKCLGTYNGAKPNKDPGHNNKIFGRKQRTSIVWSKEYLRFTWRRVW